MKTSALREKAAKDLASMLTDMEKELCVLNIKKGTDQKTEGMATHKYRKIRRGIARIKTILGEKIKSNS